MSRLIKIIAMSCLLLVLVLSGAQVEASDVSGADYLTTIQISNAGGTALTNEVVAFTANTSAMIDALMLNAYANDTAMLTGAGGSDIVHMPGSSSTWCTWVDSIGAGATLNQYLYHGGATGGLQRIILADAGMYTTDNASMEMGTDWLREWTGYFDSDAGTGKYLLDKRDADNGEGIEIFNSATVAENITANLTNVEWASFTGGSGTSWTNVANAYDDDTGTYASYNIAVEDWSTYIELTVASTDCKRVRYYLDRESSQVNNMELDIYYGGAYHNLYTGVLTQLAWAIRTDTDYRDVTKIRMRFYNSSAADAQWVRVHEAELEDRTIEVLSIDGVEEGERTILSVEESPFWALGADNTTALTPIADNLVYNAPLWQTECDDSPFTTIDSNEWSSTPSANATWTNQGYDFNGNNSYINSGDDNILRPGNKSMTFEAWFKLDSIGADHSLFSKGNITGSSKGSYHIYINSSNDLYIYYQSSTGKSFDTNFVADTWYHVVVVCNHSDDSITVYVNNSAVGSPSSDSWQTSNVRTEPLYLGANYFGAITDEMDGLIGEARIYGELAFTSDNATRNYNATAWRYTGDTTRALKSTLNGVPDVSTATTESTNGVFKYLQTSKTYLSGVLTQSLAWNYGSTLDNLAGVGNDAVPTYRTTSTNANLSATIASQEGLVTGTAPTISTEGTTMISDVPATPGGLFDEGGDSYGIAGIDVGGEVTNRANEAGQDADSWHFILAYGLAAAALLGGVGLTHKAKMGVKGSLLVGCFMAGAVLFYFYQQRTIPGFTLIPIGLIFLALLAWRKSPAPID